MAKTIFGKLLQGAARMIKGGIAATTGIVIPNTNKEPVLTDSVGYWTPGIAGGDLRAGAPEVTVTATPISTDKPIGQKLMDLLDVASGNKPFITDVGVSENVIPKWVFPAAFGVAGLMLYKSFTRR